MLRYIINWAERKAEKRRKDIFLTERQTKKLTERLTEILS